MLFPLKVSEQRTRPPASRSRSLSRISAFDVALAALSPLLAFLIRDGGINRPDIVAIYCAIAIIASLVSFQWFKTSTGIWSYFSLHDASKILQACLTTVGLTAVVLFTLTRLDDAPRSIPVIHLLILAGGLLCHRTLYRIAAKATAASEGEWHGRTESVLIIDASRLAWLYSKMMEELAPRRSRIVAILDERPELHNRSLNGYSIVGSPAQISKIVDEYRTHGVDITKVVIATHPGQLRGPLWEEVRATCDSRNIRIEWLPELLSGPWGHDAVSVASVAPSICPDIQLAERRYWTVKRLLDVVLATGACIIVMPMTLLVALLVVVDVGFPVVFWQQRLGRFGRPLHVYKFRTMRATYDREGRAISDPDRLSAVGRMLRRNRLDELPQLINILTGDMSFVGPRPLLPIDQPQDLWLRLQVRPGLTGLAQINGGVLLSREEKEALDEWYVQHASLWLDLKILIRTAWVVMRGDRRNENEISAAVMQHETKVPMGVERSMY